MVESLFSFLKFESLISSNSKIQHHRSRHRSPLVKNAITMKSTGSIAERKSGLWLWRNSEESLPTSRSK